MEGLAPSNLAMSLGLDWNLFVLQIKNVGRNSFGRNLGTEFVDQEY